MNINQIRSETLENIRYTAEFLSFFAVLKTMMRAVYEDAIETTIFYRSSCSFDGGSLSGTTYMYESYPDLKWMSETLDLRRADFKA